MHLNIARTFIMCIRCLLNDKNVKIFLYIVLIYMRLSLQYDISSQLLLLYVKFIKFVYTIHMDFAIACCKFWCINMHLHPIAGNMMSITWITCRYFLLYWRYKTFQLNVSICFFLCHFSSDLSWLKEPIQKT